MIPRPGDHARLQALMPWVLNGRADEAQRAELDRHLARCPACREDMARQRQLQAALQLPAAAAPDVESGLAQLMQRVELDAVQTAPTDRHAVRGLARSQRVSLALAACVALQAVALAVVAPQAWHARDGDYRTLSQAEPRAAAQLRVVPSPQLSLAEWQALLQAEGLQVADGPNQAGAYALRLARPSGDVAALVGRLRSHPGLRFVEPMPGGAP